ncbi:MAG TPA: sigma-70 family RNA polymerase sigma factor [Polyangiales bacterium]|nr:sigma-70 family RNA polymerase sigma factor [Polyangiales bacterium]
MDALLRELAPQVTAALTRRVGDFARAEDAVQEALIQAAEQWPREGVPANPRGWLLAVAQRRATDALRSDIARRKREEQLQEEEAPPPERDDSLLLLFMCCHPSLTPSSSVALTLRAVGGLSTTEIARAYFVPEATMAQRISRAKATIKRSNVAFAMPDAAERDARVVAVLHVLYLIFNEGYASSEGDELLRTDLSREAIRLTRGVHHLLPGDCEVAGLLALMLLTDARREARTGASGELIPLDEQDRTLWDRALIEEGVALISETLPKQRPGPYQLQAAIAAVHDEAASAGDTDWPQIVALYEVLEELADNPMVTLNRAIAVAMVEGPSAALAMLEPLDQDARVREHHRLAAVRAHLHEKSGDLERASELYLRAAERTTSKPEQDYLRTKLAALTGRVTR